MNGAPRALRLDRPIAFFDLETTGLHVGRDRIVEICVAKVHPDGHREVRTRRVHPGMAIPPGATAIHGIGDADVADCPRFEQIAKGLHAFLHGCDLGGFNVSRFDVPLLSAEFGRAGLTFPDPAARIVDAYAIFASRERRDLAAAVQFYCGRALEGAHSAETDVLATIDVLQGQLARYPDLPDDVARLAEACRDSAANAIDRDGKFVWQDGEAVFAFGPHRGLSVRAVAASDRGFLSWMLRATFADDAKAIAKEALCGRFPRQDGSATG